jgi:hypothetical protein
VWANPAIYHPDTHPPVCVARGGEANSSKCRDHCARSTRPGPMVRRQGRRLSERDPHMREEILCRVGARAGAHTHAATRVTRHLTHAWSGREKLEKGLRHRPAATVRLAIECTRLLTDDQHSPTRAQAGLSIYLSNHRSGTHAPTGRDHADDSPT